MEEWKPTEGCIDFRDVEGESMMTKGHVSLMLLFNQNKVPSSRFWPPEVWRWTTSDMVLETCR